MAATPLTEVGRRVLANVDADRGDYASGMLRVPVADYLDPDLFAREVEAIFRRKPIMVALTCDVPDPGDYTTLDIADRPLLIMRGEDGVGSGNRIVLICRDQRELNIDMSVAPIRDSDNASIGVVLGRPGAVPDVLVHDADTAMYDAKHHSRAAADEAGGS